MEVVASLSQGCTAAAQCGFFKYKSVPVIFEPPCIIQWLLPVVFRAVVFKLLVWCGAEGYVFGLQDAAACNGVALHFLIPAGYLVSTVEPYHCSGSSFCSNAEARFTVPDQIMWGLCWENW